MGAGGRPGHMCRVAPRYTGRRPAAAARPRRPGRPISTMRPGRQEVESDRGPSAPPHLADESLVVMRREDLLQLLAVSGLLELGVLFAGIDRLVLAGR